MHRLGIVHDTLVACLSMTVAMLIAWGLVPLMTKWQIWALIGIYALLSALIFPLFKLNSGAWRYASLLDAVAIVKAVTVINVVFLFGSFVLFRGAYLPRTTIITSWFVMIVGLGGPRLAYRLMKESSLGARSKPGWAEQIYPTILIQGFNDNADLFIRDARRNRHARSILGILDGRSKNRHRQLHGVHVLGAPDELEGIAKWARQRGTPISELVIAEASMSPQELSEIVAAAAPLQITVKRLPDISRAGVVDGNAPIEPLPVSLEDLLGRKVVDLDIGGVSRLINEKLVVVTGAGGSIGSELVRQIAGFHPRLLVLVDFSEFNLWQIGRQMADEFPSVAFLERIVDVRQRDRVERLLTELKPNVVFHAAALKHVPIVEDNPLEGIHTNLLGTRNVADAALACGVSAFVMVSTDKAVNPTNVMGATKRAAEAYCQALDLSQDVTRFVTVRFGNVLGSTGSVIPLFRSQLVKGGPLTVTHPQIRRFFMTIPEATRLILHAASHGKTEASAKGKVYVLDMGEPVRIVELAERLIQLAGLRPHVDIEIRFVGLRKGEKLHEELFADGETREETDSEGLMFARSRISDLKLLARGFENMEAAVASGDAERALSILRHIVPDYRPSPHVPVAIEHGPATSLPSNVAALAPPSLDA